ncbi:hypothetical protein AeMF1_011636, partial [Aphanomyces euteiches]
MGRKRKVLDTSNEDAGDKVLRARVAERTRAQYNTMTAYLKRWLEETHPTLVRGSEIKLPLEIEICKAFLASVTKKKAAANGKAAPNSFSTVNGYINAIKFLYRERKISLAPDLDVMLKDFSNGYKRQVAKFKEDGLMSINEGKMPLTVQSFRFIAHKSITQPVGQTYSPHVHCFLVLSWNLMARAASVAAIRYDHISWEGDSMLIRFGKMKNDQEGKMNWPRHVYANPHEPAICPVLSLALAVFSRRSLCEGASTLLFGSNANETFATWLRLACSLFRDDMAAVGLNSADIGTHSFRKGVSTAISNTLGGPQPHSVWLRAGWSLGSVQGRYIFAGAGGDQHVGRAAS